MLRDNHSLTYFNVLLRLSFFLIEHEGHPGGQNSSGKQTIANQCIAQDCSNSSTLAVELLQSCAKLLKYEKEFHTLNFVWSQPLELLQ